MYYSLRCCHFLVFMYAWLSGVWNITLIDLLFNLFLWTFL